jgi:hypothetical protein
MCKKTPDPLANVKTAVRRCAAFRDERDAALKTAAAALAQLEAIVDSDTATEAEAEATENEYEEKVDLLDDRFHETGIDETGSMELEGCWWIPRLRLAERGAVSWQDGVKRSRWR